MRELYKTFSNTKTIMEKRCQKGLKTKDLPTPSKKTVKKIQ